MLRRQDGKDTIIFASKEDHEEPSTINLPEADPQPGLIFDDGTINWNCPCLGGMATGPCGVQFREAFSCFHYSTSETKGSECVNAFSEMQKCMLKYPKLYASNDEDKNDYGLGDLKDASEGPSSSKADKTTSPDVK